jgi:WD40 repeat protein
MRYRMFVGAVALLAAVAPATAQESKPDVKAKLEGHRGGVTALAFAPGGETIATGSGNGLVRLWDAKTGEMQVKLDSFGGTKVVNVGFSADGKIFSAAARKSVNAWSLAELKKPKQVFTDAYQESAYKLGGVSGDGKRVYFYDTNSSTLRYHDAKEDTNYPTDLKSQKFTPLAFTAICDAESSLAVVLGTEPEKKGGVLVFVGLGDKWQLSDGVKAPDTNSNRIGFSPDGKWLALCCGGEAMVWKVPGSQKVSGKPRDMKFLSVTAVAAGPNNVLAVAQTVERKARVHLTDLTVADELKITATFVTEIDDVSGLAFSPDGKWLAVADNTEGVVQLWALPAKK